MSSIRNIFIFLIIALLPSCSIFYKEQVTIDLGYQKLENDKIIAKVNGKPIYLGEAKKQLKKINKNVEFDSLKSEGKKIIIEEVAAQKLLLKDALNNGYKKIKSKSIKEYTIVQIQQNHLNNVIGNKIEDKEVRAKYDFLVESIKGKNEYRIKHILVETKNDANKVFKKFKTSSFEDTARKMSTDTKTAKNGGDLGYIMEAAMPEEFKKVVLKLKKGRYSKSFKTYLGWHIVKLVDKRKASPAEYAKVRKRIKESLINDEKQLYIKALLKDAKIEILTDAKDKK